MRLLDVSLQSVGITEAIVVSDDNYIISGNARYEKLKDDAEVIEVETEGEKLVVVKRKDIKFGTKKFAEAGILANTVADKNFSVSKPHIRKLSNEYGITPIHLGVDMLPASMVAKNSTVNNGDVSDFERRQIARFPIIILADETDALNFDSLKERYKIKDSKALFKKILKDLING